MKLHIHFRNRVTSPWVGRLVFWAPFVLALCVARQVTQSYLPRVLKPKESEQVSGFISLLSSVMKEKKIRI